MRTAEEIQLIPMTANEMRKLQGLVINRMINIRDDMNNDLNGNKEDQQREVTALGKMSTKLSNYF